MSGSVNVTAWLSSQGLLTGTREERDASTAAGWDSVAAYVKRSTDAQIRHDNPGIGDEAVARWRWQAANPPAVKRATDFWYAP